DLRNDVLKDGSIRLEQPEPSDGIAAIGCASAFFVDSGSDHHHGRASTVGIVPGAPRNGRRQDGAVLDIRHDALGPLAVPVDQHDLARTPPHYSRTKTCGAARTPPTRSH